MRLAHALLFALTLPATAAAADEPGPWARLAVGGGGWPSGAIADARVQWRAPLYRSDSIVFQDTYAGAGLKIAASPAFVEVGPRLSLAPIDVFDVDVQASYHGYWKGQYGLLPFSEPRLKLESDRQARSEETFAGRALTFTVSPTLKARLGPVVAMDSWSVGAWFFGGEGYPGDALVYEPFSDLVMARSDIKIEHQAALMYTILPGDEGAKLWVGATFRDRWSVHGGDRSTVLGGLAMIKPARADNLAVPSLVVQVLPYLRDADRVGGPPNVQLLAAWVLDDPEKRDR